MSAATRPRRRGERFTRFQAGLIALVVIVFGTYLAFAGHLPFFGGGFELKATFDNTSALQLRSPVRIAGVQVGEVTKVESAGDGSTASTVTMELDDSALPIHDDAKLKIRPRIFLEGNFFIDLEPGTPGASEVASGHDIPATQTSAPVQLDQVLGTLQSDARSDLQKLVAGYGEAIAGEPTPGEDADQDPLVKGDTAGEALNKSLDYSPEALRSTAVTNDALLGTNRHDLAKLIKGGQKVATALASREGQLRDLITNFNTTTGALALEQQNLRATVRRLPKVLAAANPALTNLNKALPPTRAFAREVLPGVRQTQATIDAALPWIAQTRKLVSPAELQGLVRDLQPAVDKLATTTDATVKLLPRLDLLNRCLLNVVLPTGDEVIQDGSLTTGVKNYQEFFQALVGLSGESQNFDGNGSYTRFQPGGGAQTVSTGSLPGVGRLFGNATSAPLGTRPARPAKRPPYRRDATCYKQKPPDLNAAKVGGGP
jgi:ABC-type transporter Mla subunit MlaD